MKGTPVYGTTGTCTYDRFKVVQGDPRGRKRTVVGRGTLGAVSPLAPPYAPSSSARSLAPSLPQFSDISVYLSISQNSVYLGSQYISDLSISRISVYLGYISVISQYFSLFHGPAAQRPVPRARSHCSSNEEPLSSAEWRGYCCVRQW